jgi:prefoldin alpha subunit
MKLSIDQIVMMAENEKKRMAEMENQAIALQNMMRDTDNAIASLSEIKEIPEKDIYMSLGAGIYAKVALKDAKKLLVSMPGGVVIGKSHEEAKAMLTARNVGINKDLENLQKGLQSTAQNLSSFNRILEQVAAAQREKKP